MSKTVVKFLLLVVLALSSIQTSLAQKVVCPNFQAGHDTLNKLITKHLPVDSAKTLYFQFGWAANNLRLYSNVIVDFEDIMPYAFYKEVEKGFVYVSTEKLQYFYMQYEYGSGISKCWIRNTALENPPERKPKPVIKEETKKDTTLVISSKTAQIDPALKRRLQELKKENAGKGSGEGFGTGSPGSGTGSPDGRGSTYKPKQQIEVIEDDEIEVDVETDYYDPMPEIQIKESSEVLEIHNVEQVAQYRGGDNALNKFIVDNITYPNFAKENNISGTVIVQFTVNKYGYVTDVITVGSKKFGYGLEQEAMRVIKLTNGRWTPAKRRDQPVAMRMRLPVKFALN